ncbi:MAG: GGDEF domain-containing protein [Pseudomonadota bacterium]
MKKAKVDQTVRPEDLISCLDFFSCHPQWEEAEEFYRDMEEFLAKNWNNIHSYIFSYPKIDKSEHTKEKMLRNVWWHDKTDKNTIDLEEWPNILWPLIDRPDFKDQKHVVNEGRYHCHVFYLGQEEKQAYVMCLQFEGQSPLGGDFLDYLIKFSQTSFAQVQNWNHMRRRLSLAYIDDVSGLYNQRKLFEDLEAMVRKHYNLGENFAVFFLDIDYFKKINDGHGHLIGTSIIAQLGKSLKRYLRESDLVYRYGGDEFVMILSNAALNEARLVGERVLSDIHSEIFYLDSGRNINISVSIGIATFPEDAKDTTEILRMADRMMYEAKERGRGQVCLAADILHKKA